MWSISRTLQATPSLKDALTAFSPPILVSLCNRCIRYKPFPDTISGQKLPAYPLSTQWEGLGLICMSSIVSAGLARTRPNRL